ncbi:hypothetical protein J4234_00165 [Candidatus Woesearchaeota archaeon]|nr:hypothetical protein [Candidatus Woesearchaeota archaeon]
MADYSKSSISLIDFDFKMRLIALFLILFLLSLASSLSAKALAVASDHLEGNTLTLIEGTSKIYGIRLQNPDSSESRVKVDYDGQFMKLLDYREEYILPPQSSTRIEFNVTAPNYDKNNDSFTLSYTVHQLSAPSGSGIPFLTKINKNFKLKVARDPNKFYIDYDSAAYLTVILAFLLYIFWKKNKARKGKRKFRKFL